MNAPRSGRPNSAPKIGSPSFSRSSSSTTTTARPAAISAMALSMGSSMCGPAISFGAPAGSQQAFGVLGEHVHLEVHGLSDLLCSEIGGAQGFGDQPHLE